MGEAGREGGAEGGQRRVEDRQERNTKKTMADKEDNSEDRR